ncbi:MAG: 5-formyltetrahydrofolate cyclo-ligase, partial [Alphaproteobacteria bacterium]|nr:5-formyltetrahydrofolate cyclo-ligase [Alphaproteobacteria bacterium]
AGELVPGRVASGYVAMDSELDPAPLLRHFAVAGLRLCLPVTGRRGTPLTFRAWRPGDRRATGVWGIPVPADDAPALEPDLLLVPLLAFDRYGNRLGYGAGFYDRTIGGLRAKKRIVTVGIGFAGQFRPRVPVGPRDERLDWIVTEAGAWRVKDSA